MPPRHKHPGYVHIWTPQLRLYAEDEEVFRLEPFATVFATYRDKKGLHTRSDNYLLENLDDTLDQPRYIVHLLDWLNFTLGPEIVAHMPPDALVDSRQLFLNVLFACFQYNGERTGEDLAYELLQDAQKLNFNKYFDNISGPDHVSHLGGISLPADICWNDDLDLRQTWDQDSAAGDRDSDWEDEEDNEESEDLDRMDEDLPLMDEDWVDDRSQEVDKDSNSQPAEDLPGFVKTPTSAGLSVLPKKPHRPQTSPFGLSYKWAKNMSDFFYSGADETVELSARNVVDDLVDMRKIPASVYDHKSFKTEFEESGLFELMRAICTAGNMLETSHPDIEDSFRWHDWKISYAEMIC
ncbi:hypothetical protein B0H13DRAFT_2339977 [Mycena leptocephala]|nr:hypothetical protein B0H13DRAFT_2339977 [Mycena leptocephala]